MAQNKEMTNCFTPTLLLGETHFFHRNQPGVIAAAIDRMSGEGFFRGVEIADVAVFEDRRRIGRIMRDQSTRLTYWTSMILYEEQLNLSALDEDLRRKSVARIKQEMNFAAECEAACFAVLSGPDPGPAYRAVGTEQLFRSLCELAEALKAFSGLRLLLEPLDREAHKNALIGPTPEAVGLARRVRQIHPMFGLSWDTAHAALCGEDLFEAIRAGRSCIAQIHLANAVLDRQDPRFGDHHMPIGKPGFLDVKVIADLFRMAMEIGWFGDNRPGVSVEVRTAQGNDPWETVTQCRRILEEAWTLFAEGPA